MSESLSVVIKQGFLEVADLARSEVDPAELRARARDRSLSPAEHDAAFAEALARYRSGQRSLWGPVILELLAPSIMERLVRLEPPLGGITDGPDLTQQVVMEVLRAAATVPLRTDPAYLRLRVLRRLDKAIGRWLEKEAGYLDRRNELTPEMTKAMTEPWR